MSKRIINFDERVDNLLQELKQELKIPTNKIITMIINEKLEDIKRLKKLVYHLKMIGLNINVISRRVNFKE